jgi:hypothetical protein
MSEITEERLKNALRILRNEHRLILVGAIEDAFTELETERDEYKQTMDKFAHEGGRLLAENRLLREAIWQSSDGHFPTARQTAAEAERVARLEEVATDLYMAGYWTRNEGTPQEDLSMWEALRDALGLPEGTATKAGVAALAEEDKGTLYDAARNGPGHELD